MPITRHLTRSLTSPLTRALTEPGGGGFSPVSLFASGEQGAWYDPSDLSSMFQDTAGTIPVTAVGQPVARINDKSGVGLHALQATGANQPTLEQDVNGNYYLDFNGTTDFLAVAFAPTAYPLTMATAVYSNTTQDGGILSVMQSDSAYKRLITSTTPGAYAASDRNATPLSATSAAVVANRVLVAEFGVAALSIYADSVPPVSTANTNAFGAPTTLFLGKSRTAGLFFLGRFFGGIVINRSFSTVERGQVQAYLAGKSGVAL